MRVDACIGFLLSFPFFSLLLLFIIVVTLEEGKILDLIYIQDFEFLLARVKVKLLCIYKHD